MVRIDLNNNKFKLSGDLLVLDKVYESLSIKHPNAWHLRPHMQKGWDGKVHYMTQAGYVKTGFLNRVIDLLEELEEEYYINDRRDTLEVARIPYKLAEFIPRAYQKEAVRSIVYNTVGDIMFPRGVIGAATNAGKTIIAAMLYLSFKDARAMILLKDSTLYHQFMEDMPKFFGDDWGYMKGKKLRWGRIMVCMTPTLRNRLNEYSDKLATYNMILFDECHESPSKTNKKVIQYLHNAYVRVGLSGTAFLHKDPTRNYDVESFFGPELYKITNLELIEKGFSSQVVVKILKGNTTVRIPGDYQNEYREGISISEERNIKLVNRVKFYRKRGRVPILIVCKFHEHVEFLYELLSEAIPDMDIKYIHHKVKDRNKILKDFKEGKFPILISSLIVKLGQNIPLMKVLLNASSGDSHINTLQIVGRALRTHESKDKVYIEDFFDEGKYLKRHSKHRIKYYKDEGFKVIEKYKYE